MAEKKKTTKKHADVEVVEAKEPKTKKIPVTLASGREIEIEILADQNDWSFGALEAMEQEHHGTLLSCIMTKASSMQLKSMGTLEDLRMVVEIVSNYFNDGRTVIED